MSRLRTARLCTRAGSAMLSHLPPLLRSHLSELPAARMLDTKKLREGAEGMEKGLGISAEAIELLHQRSGGTFKVGDPVRVVADDYIGRQGHIHGDRIHRKSDPSQSWL